jgi:hypothetical protein
MGEDGFVVDQSIHDHSVFPPEPPTWLGMPIGGLGFALIPLLSHHPRHWCTPQVYLIGGMETLMKHIREREHKSKCFLNAGCEVQRRCDRRGGKSKTACGWVGSGVGEERCDLTGAVVWVAGFDFCRCGPDAKV